MGVGNEEVGVVAAGARSNLGRWPGEGGELGSTRVTFSAVVAGASRRWWSGFISWPKAEWPRISKYLAELRIPILERLPRYKNKCETLPGLVIIITSLLLKVAVRWHPVVHLTLIQHRM